MPKVTKEYMDNKRNSIVDCCYQVCIRKPVSSVTMMDIINETGLSQGGIYRYFNDLDEILRAMIMKMRQHFGIIEETDQYFNQAKDLTVAEFATNICSMLSDRMERNLMDIQKINFDLSVLAINEPERVKKILDGIKTEGNMEHLTKCTVELFTKGIKEGSIKPRVNEQDLMRYISCVYNGIEMNCIISNCYKEGPMKVNYSPKPLFDILAKTIIYLLGEEEWYECTRNSR